MSLSCEYDDYDGDGWYYFLPADFSTLAAKRAKRCCSCKVLCKPGSEGARFERYRSPVSDIEERIHGDEVPLADYWMCEECAGLFFSLSDLGYCISIDGESMRSLVRQHAEMHRRSPKEQAQ